jgi:DNA-binding LytR/AlgR family response regulator
MAKRCLIIEDDTLAFNRLSIIIQANPKLELVDSNVPVINFNHAIQYIHKHPDIIFLDNNLGGHNQESIEFLETLWNHYQSQPHLTKPVIIICSNYWHPNDLPDVYINAFDLKIDYFIRKIELSPEKVEATIQLLVNNNRLLFESINLNFNAWDYIAETNANVNIQSNEILFVETKSGTPNYVSFIKIPPLNAERQGQLQELQNLIIQRREIERLKNNEIQRKKMEKKESQNLINEEQKKRTIQNWHNAEIEVKSFVNQVGQTIYCEAISVHGKMNEIERNLETATFIRSHNSYILNFYEIDHRINQNTGVVFKDNLIPLTNCISENRAAMVGKLFQ